MTTAIELDKTIESVSKLIHFMSTKLTIIGVEFPALIVTVTNYFMYDLEENSYVLPFPMMYVHRTTIFY